MTCILDGWQAGSFVKILTKTTNKALFTTQKPRIYVTK